MVFDDKTGFLVNYSDLRKKFGVECKNIVLKIFNWNKLVRGFINIVTKIINQIYFQLF